MRHGVNAQHASITIQFHATVFRSPRFSRSLSPSQAAGPNPPARSYTHLPDRLGVFFTWG
jgi:hypothetical protein